MNTKRTLQWTEIDTDVSDETGEEFKVNLNKNEDEALENEFEKGKDHRRSVFTTTQKEVKEDDEDGTEVEEDQDKGTSRTESPGLNKEDDEGEPKKSGRARKRIKSLLGRLSEKDQEIQRLQAQVHQVATRSRVTEKNAVIAQKNTWEQALKDKEAALEEAANKGDGKEVARLSRELADATMKFNAFSAVADDFENEEDEPVVQQRQQPVVAPEAAKEWLGRNPWFRTDAKKHVMARMISQELTNEGELDPNDDEYWEELDKRMGDFVGKTKETKEEPKKQAKKGSPVGSRSDEDSESTTRVNQQFTRTGNRVQATPTESDKDMAERLGVDIKGYMKEKYKYAQQDFKGYVPIDVPGQ